MADTKLEDKLLLENSQNRRKFIGRLTKGLVGGGVTLAAMPGEALAAWMCDDIYETVQGPCYPGRYVPGRYGPEWVPGYCETGRIKVGEACSAAIQLYGEPIARQDMSQWCWAACIEAIFSYHGHPVSQKRIVKETFGRTVNLPGRPDEIFWNLNKRWRDDYGRRFRASSRSLNMGMRGAIEELADNQPMIIGTLGHAMVLSSMHIYKTPHGSQLDMVTVNDPWPGKGVRTLSPREWNNINFTQKIRVY